MRHMTGYDLAKIASEKLGRTIRPQMVYNYIKKGFIPSVVVEGKTVVTVEAAAEFIRKQANSTTADKSAKRADLSAAIDELL